MPTGKMQQSTTTYYSSSTKYTPILFCTTTCYSSATPYCKVLLQYYPVLQSTTPVLLCFMLGFDVTYASCHNLYPCSPSLDTLYLSRPKRSNTFSSNKEGHSELCATRENKSPIRLLLLHPDSRKTFHGSGAGLVRYQQLT